MRKWIELFFLPKSKDTHLIRQVELPSSIEVEDCVERTRMSGWIHHHHPHYKHRVSPVKEKLIVNKGVV